MIKKTKLYWLFGRGLSRTPPVEADQRGLPEGKGGRPLGVVGIAALQKGQTQVEEHEKRRVVDALLRRVRVGWRWVVIYLVLDGHFWCWLVLVLILGRVVGCVGVVLSSLVGKDVEIGEPGCHTFQMIR